jgi:hypothetical protein
MKFFYAGSLPSHLWGGYLGEQIRALAKIVFNSLIVWNSMVGYLLFPQIFGDWNSMISYSFTENY